MKILCCILASGIGIVVSGNVLSEPESNVVTKVDSYDPKPSLQIGASVFLQRCSLCHGNQGAGDGVIPSKIKNYPPTDLFKARFSTSRESVLKIAVYGGSHGDMSNFMPPMGNDLTWTQLESIVDFIMFLRSDKKKAIELLDTSVKDKPISRRVGQQIFKNRCTLCHGKYGEGNGRMAKVIKSPPPFDLTASRLPDDYLKKIISEGGEFIGRSKQMPPWKNELNENEIDSVIIYIKTMRD